MQWAKQNVCGVIDKRILGLQDDSARARGGSNGRLLAEYAWLVEEVRRNNTTNDEESLLLQASDKQLDLIFSAAVYEAYYTYKPAYSLMGMQQIPYEQNTVLQQLVEATKVQTHGQLENITQTTGFAAKSKGSTQITYVGTEVFYKNTLDASMFDIHSGAFSYEQVLNRTIKTMTDSGLRYIQYRSKSLSVAREGIFHLTASWLKKWTICGTLCSEDEEEKRKGIWQSTIRSIRTDCSTFCLDRKKTRHGH